MIKTTFKHADLKCQLVPPHSHRNNLAERAIQTYKHHIEPGLAIIDPNFSSSE